MGEIPFTLEGGIDKIRHKDVHNAEKRQGKEEVPGVKARNKTSRRKMESPKSIRKENENSNPAEHLGNFLENVAPKQIAIGIIEDYKKEVDKELRFKGIDKNKYDNPVEYMKAVGEVSEEIARGFKIFEKKIYERDITRRVRDGSIVRGEALIKEVELNNVFEGKNIKLVLKEGAVAKKEYEEMLKFQGFLPIALPKIYDFIPLENTGVLVMEKIEDETLEQLINDPECMKNVLRAKPKIFSDLGKIIAIMDNNNFIHMDLDMDNIMLSKDFVWKIIDFEFSKHHEGRRFIKAKTYNLKQLDIDEVSDKLKNKSIKSDFYEGYLLSRNLKEDIRFMSREEQFNKADITNYVKGMNKMINSISVPSGETREYFVSLISEINNCMNELIESEKEDNIFKKRIDGLKDFKNGIEKYLEKETPAK